MCLSICNKYYIKDKPQQHEHDDDDYDDDL